MQKAFFNGYYEQMVSLIRGLFGDTLRTNDSLVAKNRYDGYLFKACKSYCPWDVLNYCDDLLDSPNAQPEDYWIDTSGNDVIKWFVAQATDTTRDEIERLVAGGSIERKIKKTMT